MNKFFSGILFDFDGVLADTPKANYAAWSEALSEHGLGFSFEECSLLEGRRVYDVATSLLEKAGKDPSLAKDIGLRKDQIYNARSKISFYPGVMELVDGLREAKVKIGVVSGGARARLVTAQTESFLALFDAVVTADDCKLGKPHAEPYLKGAERLGLKAGDCLVVENAPLGLESARNGGIECVALCTTLTPKHLSIAAKTYESFSDFAAQLEIAAGRASLVF